MGDDLLQGEDAALDDAGGLFKVVLAQEAAVDLRLLADDVRQLDLRTGRLVVTEHDDLAARTDHIDGVLQHVAHSLDAVIHAQAVGLLQADLYQILLGGIHHTGGAALQRLLTAVLMGLGNNDLRGAVGLGHGGKQQAHGTGAQYAHRITSLDLQLLDGVAHAREGLGQGGQLIGCLVVDLVHRLGRHTGVAAQSAVGKQATGHAVLGPGSILLGVQGGALTGAVAAAVVAMAAGGMRIHDHLVAGLQGLDGGTDSRHLAAVLVAEDNVRLGRMLWGIHQHMQIRAADANAQHLDLNVVGILDLRNRSVLIGVYARLLKDNRFHCLVTSCLKCKI